MNIDEYKALVHNTLEKYFDECEKKDKRAKTLFEAMKYTTLLGGKRLRAIFCLETCKMISGDYTPALAAACAVEMLHAQSLIHDDLPCMDNDDLRRGKPSNHKVFGEANAVLAGDALISFGAQTIIEKTPENIEKTAILDAVNIYLRAAGAFGIVAGQVADIEAENSKEKIDLDGLTYIQQYKTAALFEGAFLMGARLAGASENQTRLIKDYAQTFGLAFQIYDDIIDTTATTEELGKTAGKDAKNNKSTYVTLFGIDFAKSKLNELILKSYDILEELGLKSKVFLEITEKMQKVII